MGSTAPGSLQALDFENFDTVLAFNKDEYMPPNNDYNQVLESLERQKNSAALPP